MTCILRTTHTAAIQKVGQVAVHQHISVWISLNGMLEDSPKKILKYCVTMPIFYNWNLISLHPMTLPDSCISMFAKMSIILDQHILSVIYYHSLIDLIATEFSSQSAVKNFATKGAFSLYSKVVDSVATLPEFFFCYRVLYRKGSNPQQTLPE